MKKMLSRVRQSIGAVVPVVAVAVLLGTSPAVTAVNAAPKPPASPAAAIPVVGTVVGGGSFTGVLSITSFAAQGGQVFALGTVSGVATNAAGQSTAALNAVRIPISIAAATCDILHLDLGPLSLNILGLQVDLSRIVLDITAQAGAGNLLGNLLCAVAGLLDNPGGLARVLNDILAALLA
jgi:hypothetical protein